VGGGRPGERRRVEAAGLGRRRRPLPRPTPTAHPPTRQRRLPARRVWVVVEVIHVGPAVEQGGDGVGAGGSRGPLPEGDGEGLRGRGGAGAVLSGVVAVDTAVAPARRPPRGREVEGGEGAPDAPTKGETGGRPAGLDRFGSGAGAEAAETSPGVGAPAEGEADARRIARGDGPREGSLQGRVRSGGIRAGATARGDRGVVDDSGGLGHGPGLGRRRRLPLCGGFLSNVGGFLSDVDVKGSEGPRRPHSAILRETRSALGLAAPPACRPPQAELPAPAGTAPGPANAAVAPAHGPPGRRSGGLVATTGARKSQRGVSAGEACQRRGGPGGATGVDFVGGRGVDVDAASGDENGCELELGSDEVERRFRVRCKGRERREAEGQSVGSVVISPLCAPVVVDGRIVVRSVAIVPLVVLCPSADSEGDEDGEGDEEGPGLWGESGERAGREGGGKRGERVIGDSIWIISALFFKSRRPVEGRKGRKVERGSGADGPDRCRS